MVIISLAAYKGGVGKTTLAVAIAAAGAETGEKVLLVDSDPQGSAYNWTERAQESGHTLGCATTMQPSANLAARLQALGADNYALTVIDTPPGSGPIVTGALEAADVALLPTRPTTADLDRLWATLDAAQRSATPALVVLTMARLGTRSLLAAREALEAGGARVARTVLPLREPIAQAFGRQPEGSLATAAVELLAELYAMDREP